MSNTDECDGCGRLIHYEENTYEVLTHNAAEAIDRREVLCLQCLDAYPDLPLPAAGTDTNRQDKTYD